MGREDLRVRRNLVIPASELTELVSRSGGPGGQHVNKSSTRVTLRWSARSSSALSERQRAQVLARLAHRLNREGELIVHMGRFRSQARNREQAREKVAELVREALSNRAPRVATRPTRASRQRQRTAKQQRSQVKRTRKPIGSDRGD